MTECKYCEGEEIIIHGFYTDLSIDSKERLISALGEGQVDLKINYCPVCGRKLDD
ncbi:hypothetical protein [Latilactobacillus curvatus]